MKLSKTVQGNFGMRFVLFPRSLRWGLLAHVPYGWGKLSCANNIRLRGNNLRPNVAVLIA